LSNQVDTKKPEKSEYGTVRCPKPECRQVLFEIEQGFMVDMPSVSTCRKCGRDTIALMSSYAEDKTGKLLVRFWCSICKDESDRLIPAIRKYCKGCKKFHQIFLSVLMGLPHCEVIEPEPAANQC